MHALMAERSDVERLAEAAHLSVQQFCRAFIAARRMTPAKTIERLRAEVAHARAEEGRETLETIAQAVGFADPERMRQSFIRVFRQTPQAMRRLARTAETAD
jgi:transcriptional regulator GlxA family with amidase domain